MNGVQKTLGHWNEILEGKEKHPSEKTSGISWLDLVLIREDEDEGSSLGGDNANPDVGLGDVEEEH